MTIIENQHFIVKIFLMATKKISADVQECPVTYCMSKIGGKWKPIILFSIGRGLNRFGILQRAIEGISKQMLTKQLRELEADGFLHRKIYAEIPPRVEYSVTELGQTLFPIIQSMRDWGEAHRV